MIYMRPSTWGKTQIMAFLKEFFAGQQAGEFKYNKEESITEIMIISQYEMVYETIGSKPVLSINENNVNPDNKVIGFLSDIDYEKGKRTYVDTYKQTLIISCVSSVRGESIRLADVVFNGFKYNRDYIMNMGFQEVVPSVVGNSQIISSDSNVDLVSTPVPVNVSYTVEWTSEPENPVLLNSVEVVSDIT